MPEDNGTGYRVLYMGLYMADKSTWRGTGTGKKRFCGHGGGCAGLVWVLGVVVWVWWWCRWCSRGATLQAARLQPYKFNDIQRVFLCLFCCGLLLGCVGVFVLLAWCTVPGCCGGVSVGCVGWGAGVVGGAGGGEGMAGQYPPSMVWSWNDKGIWNAEIFF